MDSLRELYVVLGFDDKVSKPLKAVDKKTDKVRDNFAKMGKTTAKTSGVFSKTSKVFSGMSKESNFAGNSIRRLSSVTRNAASSAQGFTSSAKGAVSSLKGWAASIAGVVGGYKLLNSTIGGAAKFEQSTVLIDAMFDDNKASKAYVEMMQKLAKESPILNSEDMLANSKSFISLSKNSKILEKTWRNVEKLNVLDPVQGVEGAVMAIRELAGGDIQSLVERFEFSRRDVKAIKDLPFDQQVDALAKLLEKMNMTDDVIKKMGNTTNAQWNRFKESASIAFRTMGTTANSEIGKALKKINKLMDGKALEKVAKVGDLVLGKAISGIIDGFNFASKAIGRVKQNLSGLKGIMKNVGTAVKGMFSLYSGDTKKGTSFLEQAGLSPEVINGLKNNASTVKTVFSTLKKIVTDVVKVFQNVIPVMIDIAVPVFEKITEVSKPIYEIFKKIGSGISSLVNEFIIPMIPVAQEFIQNAFEAMQPVISTVKNLFSTIGNVIGALVNNVIVPLIPVAKEVISTAFDIISPILRIAGDLFQVISSVVMFLVNEVVVPLIPKIADVLKTMWDIAKPILDGMVSVFNGIADAIQWAIDKFNDFAEKAKNFKMPKIGLPKWMGGNGVIQTPGHATGLARVPYDNYLMRAHEDEAVLTADQSNALRNAGILKTNANGTPSLEMGGSNPNPVSNPTGNQVATSPPIVKFYITGDNPTDISKEVRKEMENFFAGYYAAMG